VQPVLVGVVADTVKTDGFLRGAAGVLVAASSETIWVIVSDVTRVGQ